MTNDPKHPKYHAPPAIRQRAKELRSPLTPAENVLWDRLKNKQLHGLKFRRQHPLHHFILDFYCHAYRLVVEVDGGIHEHQQAYDQARADWLAERGYYILRFTNEAVLNDIETVLEQILHACQER